MAPHIFLRKDQDTESLWEQSQNSPMSQGPHTQDTPHCSLPEVDSIHLERQGLFLWGALIQTIDKS